MEREGFYQLLKSLPRAEADRADQEFTVGTPTADVSFESLRNVQGENNWLREQIGIPCMSFYVPGSNSYLGRRPGSQPTASTASERM